MKQHSKQSPWPKVRKFLTDIHLWLGLGSGLIVLCICLSGSIYVYNTEIRELSQPELYKVKPASGVSKLSAEEIVARVSKEAGGKVISIKIPSNPERSFVLFVRKDEEIKSTGPNETGQEKREQPGKREEGRGGKGPIAMLNQHKAVLQHQRVRPVVPNIL